MEVVMIKMIRRWFIGGLEKDIEVLSKEVSRLRGRLEDVNSLACGINNKLFQQNNHIAYTPQKKNKK